jgi:hypothetical protein
MSEIAKQGRASRQVVSEILQPGSITYDELQAMKEAIAHLISKGRWYK